MVWALGEALIKAKGTPNEAQIARAMVAAIAEKVSGREAQTARAMSADAGKSRLAAKEDRMLDPKIIKGAIQAIKEGNGDAALKMLEDMLVTSAGGDPSAEPDGDEGAPPPADAKAPPPAPPASGDDGDDSMKDKKPAEAGAMTADPMVAQLARKVQELEAENRARKTELEQAERNALAASRPDLAESLRAMVLDKAHPIATVRAMVAAVPVPQTPATIVRAAVVAQPTRGAGQGDGSASRLPPEEKAKLDRDMGLAKPSGVIRRERNAVVFGTLTAEDAKSLNKAV